MWQEKEGEENSSESRKSQAGFGEGELLVLQMHFSIIHLCFEVKLGVMGLGVMYVDFL